MRGSIVKRGKKYSFVIDNGRDEKGKRIQKWVSGFTTRKAAEGALNDALHKLEHGSDPFPEKMTVQDYLDSWLARKQHEVRHGTYKRYEQLIRDHVTPTIGNVRLDKLKPAHVQLVIDTMRDNGLSARTITQARSTLGTAIEQALKFGLIANNPVRATSRPRIERPELSVPSVIDLAALIKAAKDTPWAIPLLLSASTGARRGEVLALRWADLDLKAGRLRIVRAIHRTPNGLEYLDPKTDRARREVALPAFVLPILRQHRKKQAATRLAFGPAWLNEDLVCDRGDGGQLDPDSYTKAFKRIADTAGLPPKVRLHDVRHAVATTLLEQGVHPTITSSLLGHSNPAFTMSTYQHVNDSMTDKAAEALDVAFKAPESVSNPLADDEQEPKQVTG